MGKKLQHPPPRYETPINFPELELGSVLPFHSITVSFTILFISENMPAIITTLVDYYL